jgi:hypothetical protein
MKSKFILTFLLISVGTSVLLGWGMWGHQHINRAAVFALPEEMRVFFFNHIDFITESSTIPDLRKYSLNDEAEGPRHFIDVEDFGLPFDSLPLSPEAAKLRYDNKTLKAYGSLPWHIQEMMTKLTEAMKKNRRNEILFLAADLGHYIGDAHMPLHTSSNYDGQKTGQRGIHSCWEAQLPEYYGKHYNFNVGEAIYVDNVQKATWSVIRESHALADDMLNTEKQVRAGFTEETLFSRDPEGKPIKNMFGKNVFSVEYTKRFHESMNNMVERQMRKSVKCLADFWYTAWVNAGKPELLGLDDPDLTSRNKREYKRQLNIYRSGKLTGFKADKEYP